jgi:hypothetical protein
MVTLTDDHVWLEPNPHGNWLFQYEYNAKVFNESLDKVFQSVVEQFKIHWKFEQLILQDLGDSLDWYDWTTTRRSHLLDQNMTNWEMFKTYLHGKLNLIENLIALGIANKVVMRCVTNDNHSWEFGRMANYAIWEILKRIYWDAVEVQLSRRFLDHYYSWKHCFIVTHWKDEQHMKRWMPLPLNDKTINLINQYIDHYWIESEYIHVLKWDLHQLWYSKVKKFDYRNFMSFAPPSCYVQHNYWDGYSGYSIDIVPYDSNEIRRTECYLDYKIL